MNKLYYAHGRTFGRQSRDSLGGLVVGRTIRSLRIVVLIRHTVNRDAESAERSDFSYNVGVRNGSSNFLTPFGTSNPPDWPHGYSVTTPPLVCVFTFC